MSEDMKAERDALRAYALNEVDFEPVFVEHNGKRFEVRPPTYEQTRAFMSASKDKKTGEVDFIRVTVLAIIACTYVPGSELRVFERTDEEGLLKKHKTHKSLAAKLEKAVVALMSTPEEVEKNSDSVPTS